MLYVYEGTSTCSDYLLLYKRLEAEIRRKCSDSWDYSFVKYPGTRSWTSRRSSIYRNIHYANRQALEQPDLTLKLTLLWGRGWTRDLQGSLPAKITQGSRDGCPAPTWDPALPSWTLKDSGWRTSKPNTPMAEQVHTNTHTYTAQEGPLTCHISISSIKDQWQKS